MFLDCLSHSDWLYKYKTGLAVKIREYADDASKYIRWFRARKGFWGTKMPLSYNNDPKSHCIIVQCVESLPVLSAREMLVKVPSSSSTSPSMARLSLSLPIFLSYFLLSLFPAVFVSLFYMYMYFVLHLHVFSFTCTCILPPAIL